MSNEVIVPNTGELLDLAEVTTTDIAETLGWLSDREAEWRRFRRAASDELAERLDHEGRRSADVDGYRIEVNAPTERKWDEFRLQSVLNRLVDRELISAEKARRCIDWTPKVRWSEVKTLLSDPRVAPDIEACFEDAPATRYAKVKHG